jgi:hypothetical protein
MQMSPVELSKLYRSVHQSGGGWSELVAQYRESTGSEAKDTSLKSYLTNQITGLRKELAARGVSEEKIDEALPRFCRQTKKSESLASAVDFLMGEIA